MERDQSVAEISILTLPTELLVIIISYLSSRDRVHLLSVSQRLRTIGDTPLLWREFVWDYYDTREEARVKNALKRRGGYIHRLAFPGYWAPPKLYGVLQYCSNVSHLSLPIVMRWSPNQLTQLADAIQHMKNLRSLEIGMFTHIRHLLKIGLKLQELSLYVRVNAKSVIYFQLLKEWARVGFRPSKLNIIFTVYHMPMVKELIENWQQWNSKVPAGLTVSLRIYPRYKMPLNLSPVLPAFQFHFGQTVVLPFVQVKHCGMQWSEYLQVTDCCRDGKIVSMADMLLDNCPKFYKTVTNIQSLTHFDVSKYKHLLPSDLEQIAIACPNLQQIKISRCCQCLTSLHGLHALASYCHNLRGLNMIGISESAVDSQVQLWEILSKMTLTHLVVDYCIIIPASGNAAHKKTLRCFYQKFSRLVALQIYCLYTKCKCCKNALIENDVISLSYLTSLRYCEVHNFYSTTVMAILASCKQLRCYRIVNQIHSLESLSLAYNVNLKELYISSSLTLIPDIFMSSVSAHGGLVHVFLSVASISVVGIMVLIENSPELTTFQSLLEIRDKYSRLLSSNEFLQFEKTLKQRFHYHKLFHTGGFRMIRQNYTSLSFFSFLEQTDVVNLWDTY